MPDDPIEAWHEGLKLQPCAGDNPRRCTEPVSFGLRLAGGAAQLRRRAPPGTVAGDHGRRCPPPLRRLSARALPRPRRRRSRDVPSGETLLVKGANGAGKTTLLRALAGLVPVVEGEAQVWGATSAATGGRCGAEVGLLGHSAALYDDLTVADNLRFWARAARSPHARPEAALATARARRPPGRCPGPRLSAGQRRRALAVLVARSPELWLLDEPHAGLDAAGRDVAQTTWCGRSPPGRHRRPGQPRAGPGRRRWPRSVTFAGRRMVDDGACVRDIVDDSAGTGPRTCPAAA